MSAVLGTRRYGYIRDTHDTRDFLYRTRYGIEQRPPIVDLRPECPPVRDQGPASACTGFATTGALAFDRIKQNLPAFPYSELFPYYNARVQEEAQITDDGATLRDVIRSAVKQGVCSELMWPYDIAQVNAQPPQACYQQALQHKTLQYMRLKQELLLIRGCLAEGYPFVAGITVYESFESNVVAQNGIVPMPAQGEQKLGGHAVLCCGYRDDEQMFICQNSWSAQWGDKGFFYLPYSYLLSRKLAGDFWTVRTVQ